MPNPIPLTWLVAGGLGIAVVSFGAGWKVSEWRRDSQALAHIEDTIKAGDEARAKVQEEATQYEQDREHARQQGIERETRIRTIYRDVAVPGACAAPDSVRSVLDEAVRTANGGTSAESGG